uniref:Uncharacterized protein n=1 Tax=Romanomermis culicivorax TaxID=13658 RepID=A0A915I9Z4_ROMCU
MFYDYIIRRQTAPRAVQKAGTNFREFALQFFRQKTPLIFLDKNFLITLFTVRIEMFLRFKHTFQCQYDPMRE